MSTPSSDNLYLGAGELWINLYVNGVRTLWRHLGNVDKFELNPSVTTLEKKSSMSGARGTYKEVVTGTALELALTLSEFAAENLALALLGDSKVFTQTIATVTDESLGTTNSKKGYALDTGKKKITVTGVKVGAVSAVLGTDYSVDSESGLITVLPTATVIVDGSTVLWSGSAPAIAGTQIQALSNVNVMAAIRFRSATDATGPRFDAEVYKTSLAPDAALSFLSDTWGEISLKGKVYEDTSKPAGERYFRLVPLPALT
jgi:hypothetical protein